MKRVNKTISAIISLMLFIQVVICPLSVFADDIDRIYSRAEVSGGILGDTPTLNSISGESEFLSSKEAVDGTNYSSSDVAIRDEKAFWILASVRNDNPDYDAVARDVRLKISIDQISSNSCTVNAELFSSNAKPYHMTDSITFTADEPIRLAYDSGSSYIYSWPEGEQKSMKAIGDAVSDEGILLGYTQPDGVIPGGIYVSSSIRIRVIKESDLNKLRNTAKGKATVTMWGLIQDYAKPSYFTSKYHSRVTSYSSVGKLSGKKYNKVASVAKQKTAGCSSDYERMETLCRYIANRTYYDLPYHNLKTKSTSLSAYDVWKNKKTICAGYTNLYWVMLDSLGIPCMMVYGKEHVFNAAYDKDSSRWVFIDVTWCSGNTYNGKGKWDKGSYNGVFFDMDLDYILALNCHEIYGVEGVVKDNVCYEMTPGYNNNGKNFKDMSTWHWTVVGQKKKKSTVKIKSSIGGFKVREIGYTAFYAKPHIKTVYIPKTINKIGKYAFCLKNDKHIVKTKVVTSLSRKKLRINRNWTWWARKVKIVNP